MIKLPKKILGAETSFEGFHLTCKETGEEYNGVPTMVWVHDNGTRAFRSINGEITFIEPEIKIESMASDLGEKEKAKLRGFALKAISQRNFLAEFIAAQDPSLSRNAAGIGQIVNLALNMYNK